MTGAKIIELISRGESDTLEFKKSTSLQREIVETVCAFSNTIGGTIIIGVKDDGEIMGQTVSDDTLKNLVNAILLNTEPKIFVEIKRIELSGRDCILIHVPESPFKPHFAHGRPFTRIGPTNQRLTPTMLEIMLLQRQNGYRFDNQTRHDATWTDIDEEAVYQFAEQANLRRNLNINLTQSLPELLKSMEYAQEEKLTNAALLLFGKKPSRFFLGQYEIKCGVFPDNNSYSTMLDDHEFSDNLITNFNSAISFLYRHISVAFQINGFQSERKPEIPDAVLREALVNMIVHKDYRKGVKSYIEIRPGWIAFNNPGHLFQPDITIEKLYGPHTSKLGNRLLAKAFFWLGQFENWGGGTLKIAEGMQSVGKPLPEFSFEDDQIFRLKLYRGEQ